MGLGNEGSDRPPPLTSSVEFSVDGQSYPLLRGEGERPSRMVSSSPGFPTPYPPVNPHRCYPRDPYGPFRYSVVHTYPYL